MWIKYIGKTLAVGSIGVYLAIHGLMFFRINSILNDVVEENKKCDRGILYERRF